MRVIGLCGGSGSGKGAVCALLLELGIPSVDTDAVYHELVGGPSECLTELVGAFGAEIIENGALCRRALADIVFTGEGKEERLALLNGITHKHILARTRRMLGEFAGRGSRAAVVDAPLLFESGFDAECDLTVAVVADRELRIARIMSRDNITRREAERRIDSQVSDAVLSGKVDRVIINDGDLESLRVSVESLVKSVLGDI